MLKNGEIDLLSDVSLTEERTAYMSFPELPMGSELYYIYIDGDNEEITADDPHSFDGKRIGANKGSVQARCLRAWAEEHGVTPEIVELTAEEGESMDMLARGELDGYASTNSFGAKERIVPVCRIGSSDFFFAVNRQRPDLLNELNRAMNGILEEDPYFNQKMYDEYIYITGTEAFLTREQEHWLDAHGTIRIGYRDDYLPFCAQDKTTGELTGALRDYLSHAENLLKNAALSVQAVPFHTTAEAMDALRSGEIDCVFPVNLDTYDAELLDVLTTNPVVFTEMYAVLRKTDQRSVSRSRNSRVAVAAGNINTETFIKDKFPDWYVTYYADDEACMNAVASEQEDCMLRTSYRTTAAEGLLTRYRLHWLPTGETMGFSFAVGRSGRTLCFILNKTIAMTRSEDMDAALTSYMHFGERVSFSRFLSDNWPAALLCVTVMFGVILVLLFEKLKAERWANERMQLINEERIKHQLKQEEMLRRELTQQKQLDSAMQLIYTDPLTGLKSKHAYIEAESCMDTRIDNRSVSAFGVAVFELDDLKRINDTQGHESGDRCIRAVCDLMTACFPHSPLYRIGGGGFAAILEGEDYQNRERLLRDFERRVEETAARGAATVSFGYADFDPSRDSSLLSVFKRADERMNERRQRRREPVGGERAGDARKEPSAYGG